jgi:iron(III) transport system substrate-binding protein
VLAGCGSSETTADQPRAQVRANATFAPVPDSVIAAAKTEEPVLVYGNANDEQTRPVIQAFQAKYPGITIKYLSLGGTTTFQRYRSEQATGARTADLIMDNNGSLWSDFVAKGQVLDYRDPNMDSLPKFADLGGGVVAMSEDPVIALFNKKLLPEDKQPTSLAAMADMAAQFKGKIGTYEIENSLGYPSTYAYLEKNGQAGWDVLAKLGANTTPESSAGSMLTKLQQGAYVMTYNISGAVRANAARQFASLLNFRYLTDNTPLIPRGVAITKAGKSPNGAKVFLNYLLSAEGQAVGCKSGFTPYRDDVECEYGLTAIKAAVGENNVIYGNYEPGLSGHQADIAQRWNVLFRK